MAVNVYTELIEWDKIIYDEALIYQQDVSTLANHLIVKLKTLLSTSAFNNQDVIIKRLHPLLDHWTHFLLLLSILKILYILILKPR